MTSADSASFSYAGFTAVKVRKNRRNKTSRAPPPLPVQIETLREQLRQEEWFAQSSQIMSSSWSEFSSSQMPSPMLCLGLGSPSASPIARIQLAFLAETCQQLKITLDTVSVYDPVFTDEDKALFEQLQMKILTPTSDLEIKEHSTPHHLTLRVPTICFMPHCDMDLYDALLRANWTAAGLANLFIIGNRLQEYVDNKPLRVLESTVPCLLRAAPILENRPLPPSSAWPTAFNNTSVQFRLRLHPAAEDSEIAAEDDDERLFAGPFSWTDLISDAQGEVLQVVPVSVAQVASSSAEAPNTEKRTEMEPLPGT